MPGSMSLDDLVQDLKRSFHDAASVFDAADDGDWVRLLTIAAQAMAAKRPRTLLGQVVLQAGQDVYALNGVPDFVQLKSSLWASSRCLKPWEPGYPGAVPRFKVEGQAGAWSLSFETAPSFLHINAYGSIFRFWYFAGHRLGVQAADTTVAATDRPLLLLRAQAEAMRELSLRSANKPVQLRDGFSGTPRNSTPAALYSQLLAEWTATP